MIRKVAVMAPNIKISKAYKAMKALGYTSQVVKPVLKNLLDLYDKSWELIEDEQYKVLLDAIIESEEQKGNKKKERESCLLSKSSTKYERAYKTMQALGYSQEAVEPVLKSLLDLYDQSWQHIEDEQYKVLVDAILEKQESKGEDKTPLRYQISDKHLEDSLPVRRNRSKCQSLQTSPSSDHSSQNFIDGENRTADSLGKRKFPDSVCHLEDTIREAEVLSPLKHHQKAESVDSQNYFLELELTEKNDSQSGEEIDLSDAKSTEILLIDDSENDNSSSMEPKEVTDYAKETCIVVSWEDKNITQKSYLSMQKNDLDEYQAAATNDMEQLPDDRLEFSFPLVVNLPDGCGPRGHCSECKCLVSAEEKKHPVYPAQVDIASSSNGEVKISLMYNSPLGSEFFTPSLEDVSRSMEMDFLQSYGLRQSGFSTKKFMKDVCECFLAAGTITTDSNRVRAGNFLSDLGTAEKFDPQDVLIGSANHEKALCIASNNSSEAQMCLNFEEIVPQIPRLQGLNCLDLSRCKVDLPLIQSYGDICASPCPPLQAHVQKQNFPHESFTYPIEDITRGEEDVKVSLINEFNNERQPNFKYIPRNISFQNAYVKFPLARICDDACCPNCSGNCLSSEIPCACASETNGDFAYTPEGFVKDTFLEDCISLNRSPKQKNFFYCEDCPLERSNNKSLSEKCRGHLLRKFIKECWYKCGCGMECGNRVVQRGIKSKLQVFMTSGGKGWGLRTLEHLPKGAFVCEYVGEVVTNTELYERNRKNTGERHTYPVLLDADWGTEGVLKDEEALCLDATFYGNVARFINHRCGDANLVEIPVEVETPDHHYYHLAFFTRRKINALEELTWDYGIDFDDDTHPVKAFQCSCGSQFCRNTRPLKRRKAKR